MNVLSCFDGMSCGQIALNKLGYKIENYFASEIDKHAIAVTQANYPNTIQLGDITKVKGKDLPEIDLLIGGSPCQGFSFAGKQLNFEDPRSKLFFEFDRLLKETKPKYFFLENVKMKKEFQDVISKYLGVQPIELNSNLVSAQNRKRLYWTNIKGFSMPEDKGIILKDILHKTINNQLSEKAIATITRHGNKIIKNKINPTKSATICAGYYKMGGRDQQYIYREGVLCKFSPLECERLQTVPDNYTNHVSNSQRYKMLGNGWTVDAVTEFFKHIPKDLELF